MPWPLGPACMAGLLARRRWRRVHCLQSCCGGPLPHTQACTCSPLFLLPIYHADSSRPRPPGPPQARRRGCGPRAAARVVQGAHRALQGPPLLEVCGGLPHDHLRQAAGGILGAPVPRWCRGVWWWRWCCVPAGRRGAGGLALACPLPCAATAAGLQGTCSHVLRCTALCFPYRRSTRCARWRSRSWGWVASEQRPTAPAACKRLARTTWRRDSAVPPQRHRASCSEALDFTWTCLFSTPPTTAPRGRRPGAPPPVPPVQLPQRAPLPAAASRTGGADLIPDVLHCLFARTHAPNHCPTLHQRPMQPAPPRPRCPFARPYSLCLSNNPVHAYPCSSPGNNSTASSPRLPGGRAAGVPGVRCRAPSCRDPPASVYACRCSPLDVAL